MRLAGEKGRKYPRLPIRYVKLITPAIVLNISPARD
jgi:hypothetical protein